MNMSNFNITKAKTYTNKIKKIRTQHYARLKTQEDFSAAAQELKQQNINHKNKMFYAFALLWEYISRYSINRIEAYEEQIIGGLALAHGNIIESSTGSGKTIISYFPIFYYALIGKKVHVITSNTYLVDRDSTECNYILGKLGITISSIKERQSNQDKKEAYACDVIYGTAAEFGFDYLRDNLAKNLQDQVTRNDKKDVVLIDEIDSILIDDAITPLIISKPSDYDTNDYIMFNQAVQGLTKEKDYQVDKQKNTILLTLKGFNKVKSSLKFDPSEDITGLASNYLFQALKANYLFTKNKDYIVKHNTIQIVDPNTGRLMPDRTWSDGLHQAVEAKEHVPINTENATIATITIQNFLKKYDILIGMTGTAQTESQEFYELYNTQTFQVPDHNPNRRIDHPNRLFMTKKAKNQAILKQIQEAHKKHQPILIGTPSILASEEISSLLNKHGIKHELLNAKQDYTEAKIIAKAGIPDTITIATNMAGRGTDIKLGGDPLFLAQEQNTNNPQSLPTQADIILAKTITTLNKEQAYNTGGLLVIGTEHHESQRIDKQLKGRSGRQGEPGETIFYASLEDEIMTRFDPEVIQKIINTIKDKDYDKTTLEINNLTYKKIIQEAQQTLTTINTENRQNMLIYDTILNQQREQVYSYRQKILEDNNTQSHIPKIIKQIIKNNKKLTNQEFQQIFGESSENLLQTWEHFKQKILTTATNNPEEALNKLIQYYWLQSIDEHWEKILAYSVIAQNKTKFIGTAHKDPLTEYRTLLNEACTNFQTKTEQTLIAKLTRITVTSTEKS